jgi:thiol-disulfide isomerase/thioredoxin
MMTRLNRLSCVVLRSSIAASTTAAVPSTAIADSDPQAVEAFTELVESYRARPGIEVTSTLSIAVAQGEAEAASEEVMAEIVRSSDGAGIVRIRGYTCRFKDGVFTATHEKNDDVYLRVEFDGSPYWTLFDAFRELPYPHLALFWGEAAINEVCMQIAPDTPMIVPTSVEVDEEGGERLRRIVLSSGNGSLTLTVDPDTQLIRSARHEVIGGPVVQPGTKKVTSYSFEYVTHEKPLPAKRFVFTPGDRQRVDLMASLRPSREPGGADGPAAPAPGGPAQLVGEAAPPLLLATASGDAVDLAELRGKVVVLDFWATWCRPCVAALPELHAVAEWAREKALPVEVIAVNTFEAAGQAEDDPDTRLEQVRRFWKKRGFTLPVAMDYTDDTAAAYRVQGIPATFVIRSDGVVHAQHAGFAGEYAEQLKRDIRAAIAALEEPAEDDAGE